MPHVAFVPLTGLRVGDSKLLELGMSLPGLAPRANAIEQLPALGVLTLAGLTPPNWSCSYHEAAATNDALVDAIVSQSPTIVAISALTASILEAYQLRVSARPRRVSAALGAATPYRLWRGRARCLRPSGNRYARDTIKLVTRSCRGENSVPVQCQCIHPRSINQFVRGG